MVGLFAWVLVAGAPRDGVGDGAATGRVLGATAGQYPQELHSVTPRALLAQNQLLLCSFWWVLFPLFCKFHMFG